MTLPKNIEQLEATALKFWQQNWMENSTSSVPLLLGTQEQFLAILTAANSSPTSWTRVLKETNLPGNLFLKHLVVLSDIGGEKLQRLHREKSTLFPKSRFQFKWHGENFTHRLEAPTKLWSNNSLGITEKRLAKAQPITGALADVAMFLLFGSTSNSDVPEFVEENCILGEMLGKKHDLDSFVKHRYIEVSRISGGANANSRGHATEDIVRAQLQSELPDWNLKDRTISGMSHNGGRTDMTFDIVATSPTGRKCAIEISFQVTTNSTIERKGSAAQNRLTELRALGYRMAYVIDGAGNFQRRSAIGTLIQYSDYVCSFKKEEISKLASALSQWEEVG